MSTITVIGTGMIGCSLGLGLRKMGHFILGFDESKNHLTEALEIGALDVACRSLEKAIEKTDVVILATPVDIIYDTLPHILDHVSGGTIVIDTGSTKSMICENVRNHPRRKAFVATHPMAGSQFSGPMASNAHFLKGKPVAICDGELSSEKALLLALELFEQLGMDPILITSTEHDEVVGLVSHIPQLISFTFAALPQFAKGKNTTWEQLASSGFESITRIASSSPRMWLPIIAQNKTHILNTLYDLSKSINSLAEHIENDNEEQIRKTFECSIKTRAQFDTSKKHNQLTIN